MTAAELYQAGALREAIAAATEQVKNRPTDSSARGLLCELLCFAGDFERADKHLAVLADQEQQLALGVALFRQLLRAEQARRDFFRAGRVPELIAPPPRIQLHIQASICLRESDRSGAAVLLDQAEQQRPEVTGTCDGRPFDVFRDIDDLTASFFEVLTSNGKYYWVPMEKVVTIEFRPPQRARDLLWRRALLTVRDGPDGEVFLPTIYPFSFDAADDQLWLGRRTDWRTGEGQPTLGLGQRMFLVGDEDRALLELSQVTFDAPQETLPMDRPRSEQCLLPSLLDRLLDDHPELSQEIPRSRAQQLRDCKQTLRRDLENLLNTRRRPGDGPAPGDELEASLLTYGIPDIAGAQLNSPESRAAFLQAIQETIRRFEPRLKNIDISADVEAESIDRVLKFRIEALLLTEPAPEPVAFDSVVEPATGVVEVKGLDR